MEEWMRWHKTEVTRNDMRKGEIGIPRHCEHGFEILILIFSHQNTPNCSQSNTDQGSEVQF